MFTVTVTEPADSDVDEILQWLEERSPIGAARWLSSYRHAIATVRDNAGSFGLAAESIDHTEDVHEFTFSTRHGNRYRLVFIVREKTVYVLRVRGTGQSLLSPDEIKLPD